MRRLIRSLFRSRSLCLLLAVAVFIASRCFYYWMGVRFDASPRLTFWQIIDPVLLRDAPWQSLFYLRTQPPGFNLSIALTTHLFSGHPAAAFHAIYLGLGLILTICMFLLLDRLRVSRPLAFLITVICVASPVTVLYENWLFYEYPIAVLFCVSALSLHRYASSRRRIDGMVFFFSLAFLGLLRVVYNVIWFWLLAALIVYALPKCRRRTAFCAAAPGALLVLISLKSLILFGQWLPGSDVYGAMNLAVMTSRSVPPDVLAGLAAKGTVSPLMLHNVFLPEDEELLHLVPMPPRTGIRILDARLKSTGKINMDSLWMAAYANQLRRDGLVLLRSYPRAALSAVRNNVETYFMPADVHWPFDGTQGPNRRLLSPLLNGFDLATTGTGLWRDHPLVSYVTIPVLLWFGLRRSARWLKRAIRRPNGNARDLTIVFAFGNIAYLTAIIVLYSCSDQNRYLFEVFPLFAILLGSLIVLAMRRIARQAVQPAK
jgi:hypothetical protein